MKQTHFISKMLATGAVMTIITLAPAAVPIITPYPIMRVSLTCQDQTFGSVFVIDAQGHTHNQICNSEMPVATGYPMLFPATSAAWQVVVTARSTDSHAGHPRPCRFSVTRVPVHLQCASNSDGQFAVGVDISPLNVSGFTYQGQLKTFSGYIIGVLPWRIVASSVLTLGRR